MLRCSRRFLSALAIAAIIGPVHAAELGDVRVSSYIGQPLVADIELALVDDPAAVVGVRLASPEVYNGAGIATPPALAGLNLSVMRRDGRQFLHITSLRAVESEHLHLYLELADKGQRAVRLATLWLTPDPNPVPVFAAVPVAAPAAAPVPAPAVVAHTAPTPAPAAKLVPTPAPVHKAAAAAPIRAPQPQPQSLPLPLPLPIHGVQPAAPAACAQQAEQARVCVALDGKNAALRDQIGALEDKVKVLQVALKASPAAVKAAPVAHAAPVAAPPATPATKPQAAPTATRPAAPAASVPAAPKPIHAIKPLVPIKPKALPPAPAPAHEAGLPWGWIGAGVALLLALGAAAAVVLRRRRKAVPKVDLPKQPRLAERLRHSFPNRSGPAAGGATAGATAGARAAAPTAAAEMAEPSFE